MTERQSKGRDKNAATAADRPDPSTSVAETESTGRRERRSAGPDGPDATEIGDTFKR